MYIPKRYGQSKISKCPFCGRDAFSQNSQKIPVCKEHKDNVLRNMKCACGSWLDMREGKFGVFYTCINCGPVNMNKALDINNPMENSLYKVQKKAQTSLETKQESRREEERAEPSYTQRIPQKIKLPEKKETTIRSDELDFL